ncbi:hypothetical protein SKAU_G00390170 [Synaphobranchus kaupii]|uniref:Uncharacterized protein n=1 Tax=Synaphobranchus kaupii TaxID=118154 RepID=A0A9Q1EBH5_SYNKA|nr:hypothetical protein SKAU_G00390170 [Synaphobranchus kaupii]
MSDSRPQAALSLAVTRAGLAHSFIIRGPSTGEKRARAVGGGVITEEITTPQPLLQTASPTVCLMEEFSPWLREADAHAGDSGLPSRLKAFRPSLEVALRRGAFLQSTRKAVKVGFHNASRRRDRPSLSAVRLPRGSGTLTAAGWLNKATAWAAVVRRDRSDPGCEEAAQTARFLGLRSADITCAGLGNRTARRGEGTRPVPQSLLFGLRPITRRIVRGHSGSDCRSSGAEEGGPWVSRGENHGLMTGAGYIAAEGRLIERPPYKQCFVIERLKNQCNCSGLPTLCEWEDGAAAGLAPLSLPRARGEHGSRTAPFRFSDVLHRGDLQLPADGKPLEPNELRGTFTPTVRRTSLRKCAERVTSWTFRVELRLCPSLIGRAAGGRLRERRSTSERGGDSRNGVRG